MRSDYWIGYKGPISQGSAAANADYVMVQMCAAVASGQATPEAAAAEAERREIAPVVQRHALALPRREREQRRELLGAARVHAGHVEPLLGGEQLQHLDDQRREGDVHPRRLLHVEHTDLDRHTVEARDRAARVNPLVTQHAFCGNPRAPSLTECLPRTRSGSRPPRWYIRSVVNAGLGRAFGIFLTGVAAALVLAGAAASAPPGSKVLVVEFDNDVNPVTQDYLVDEMQRGESEGYKAVVIEMDTPGGLGSSMRAIVKEMLAVKVPVAVYVAPSGSSADSAGAVIGQAADILAMAPQTNIGSSTPITSTGDNFGSDLRKKVVNDAAAYIGLTLPRYLLREPWQDEPGWDASLDFSEVIEHTDDYLWGNAAVLFARETAALWADHVHGLVFNENDLVQFSDAYVDQ